MSPDRVGPLGRNRSASGTACRHHTRSAASCTVPNRLPLPTAPRCEPKESVPHANPANSFQGHGWVLLVEAWKVIVMFDQVLNEILLVAIIFILVPMMIIAAVLMMTGRRKQNR